jgi:hypothetical protein
MAHSLCSRYLFSHGLANDRLSWHGTEGHPFSRNAVPATGAGDIESKVTRATPTHAGGRDWVC